MNIRVGILTLGIMLCSCQSNFYMMPTPVVLTSGKIDAYDNIQEKDQTNSIQVFYATNRAAIGLASNRKYTVGFTDTLRFGEASIRIGSTELLWDTLRNESSNEKRNNNIELNLEQVNELAVLKSNHDLGHLDKKTRVFINKINQTLADTESKDITVYVHGSTASFFEAIAQAAQVQHFTGRNHLVLVLAWPTAENFLRYSIDVQNTAKTVPIFERLLKFLDYHTNADYINVLAYSAGAQVVSPGLYNLSLSANNKKVNAGQQHRKLAEVYYAAPDLDLNIFVQQLPAYKDFARNVTLAVNVNDFVLRMAQQHHGASRAGLPDATELSIEETQMIVMASRNDAFNLIDVSSADIPVFGASSHDFWYSNPWVSSDVLIQLLYHVGPSERGLLPLATEKGGIIWYYPPDYPERAVNAVLRLNEAHQETRDINSPKLQ